LLGLKPSWALGLDGTGVAGGELSRRWSHGGLRVRCKACGKHFEVSVPITEHDRLKKRPPECPKCGKFRVQQLVSTFSTKAPSKY
jgi:putative FmdB family regulatory protein